MSEFSGFRRPDGSVGVRNHIAVFYTVGCAQRVAYMIADRVEGAVPLGWFNCLKTEEGEQQMIGLARNPNVSAVLVVSLGCEELNPDTITDAVAESWKPVDTLVIQEAGTQRTIKKGVRIATEMVREASKMKTQVADVSDLIIGVECGGSDATSGLAANPATGEAADIVITSGGTIVCSEPSEMRGCEQLMAERAINQKVAERLLEVIKRASTGFDAKFGLDHPELSRGNIEGGLTTIEEKSLGAILKSGSTPIKGVLEPGERPTEKGGVYLVDGLASRTLQYSGFGTDGGPIDYVASGAQIVVFTTGRGSVIGNALAPVIKVTGNPKTFELMKENMDIDASTIVKGEEDIVDVGKRIYEEILAVAGGKKAKAELLGHTEYQLIGGRGFLTGNL